MPISCIQDDCGGGGGGETKITELSAMVGEFSSSEFSSLKSTDFRLATILIAISDVEYAEIIETVGNTSFSFINTAYACSPARPEPSQEIESIMITSSLPIYSQKREFSIGESLNELFKATRYTYSDGESSISEFIERQKDNLDIFGDAGASIVFQLREKPDSLITQNLTFDFEFSDSEKISIESQIFEVSN